MNDTDNVIAHTTIRGLKTSVKEKLKVLAALEKVTMADALYNLMKDYEAAYGEVPTTRIGDRATKER